MRFANCGTQDNILRCIGRPTASCFDCEQPHPYESFQTLAHDDDAQDLCMAYERLHHSYACSYEYLEVLQACEPTAKFVSASGYCTGNTVAADFECVVGTQLIADAATTVVDENGDFQHVCCEVSTDHCSCGLVADGAGGHTTTRQILFSVDSIQERFVTTNWIAFVSAMLMLLGVLRVMALLDLYRNDGRWCPCGSTPEEIAEYSAVSRDHGRGRKQTHDEDVLFLDPDDSEESSLDEDMLQPQPQPQPEPEPQLEPEPEPEPELDLESDAESSIGYQGSGLDDPGDVASVDEEMEQRLRKQKAAEGQMTVTLLWDSIDDLDLHCVTPAGEDIHHGMKRSEYGGTMDVIMNTIDGTVVDDPIEHIYWDTLPLRGRYTVSVKKFKDRTDGQATPFRVRISLPGHAPDREQRYEDVLEQETIVVLSFVL
jgi:hypothetical protein